MPPFSEDPVATILIWEIPGLDIATDIAIGVPPDDSAVPYHLDSSSPDDTEIAATALGL